MRWRYRLPLSVTKVVQVGENLAGIADDCGVSVETIMAADGLGDPGAIAAGEKLRIPLAEEQPVAPQCAGARPLISKGRAF